MKHLSKLMLAFALAATCSLGAFAQENGNRDAQNRIVRGPYETNRFFDNIFLGAAGGVNIYQGENDSYGSASERMAAALDIYVGKWLTPSVGLRLGYSGLNAKGWGTAGAPYLKNYIGEGIYREKFGISYLHADVLWNLSNAISGYKETRIWNIIPTVGFGWARTYGNDTHRNELAAHVGILNTFRLGEVVDLTLEGRQMFVNQRLDGVARGSSFEGMTSVTVGLSFKLNRRGFKRVQAPDYSAYVDRIAALERDKIALDKANVRLADQNAALRNRKPESGDHRRGEHHPRPRGPLLRPGQGDARQAAAGQPRLLRTELDEGRQEQDLHADRLGRQGHRLGSRQPAPERAAHPVRLRHAGQEVRRTGRAPGQEGRGRHQQPLLRSQAQPHGDHRVGRPRTTNRIRSSPSREFRIFR